MDVAKEFTVGRVAVKLIQDTDCSSPRENDNLGTMLCWHRNYRLGDDNPFSTPEEFMESDEYKDAAVVLPLGLYDHSGISMYIGAGSIDYGGWDSGQVGWIYVSKAKARHECEWKRLTKARLAKLAEYLTAEVREYDSFLTGDCYGFVIEDADGEQLDSCWGFIGAEYAEQEARDAGKYQSAKLIQDEEDAEVRELQVVKMERECFAL